MFTIPLHFVNVSLFSVFMLGETRGGQIRLWHARSVSQEYAHYSSNTTASVARIRSAGLDNNLSPRSRGQIALWSVCMNLQWKPKWRRALQFQIDGREDKCGVACAALLRLPQSCVVFLQKGVDGGTVDRTYTLWNMDICKWNHITCLIMPHAVSFMCFERLARHHSPASLTMHTHTSQMSLLTFLFMWERYHPPHPIKCTRLPQPWRKSWQMKHLWLLFLFLELNIFHWHAHDGCMLRYIVGEDLF